MQDEDLRDDKVEFDRQLLIKQKRARELRLDAFGARQHNLAWDQKQKAQRMRDRLAAMRKRLSFASWEDSGRGVLNGANNLGLSLYNFRDAPCLGHGLLVILIWPGTTTKTDGLWMNLVIMILSSAHS